MPQLPAYERGLTRRPGGHVPKGLRFAEPIRVVWAGPDGFGYQTMPGHPLYGEESFVLDAGFFTARSISRPATGPWRVAGPMQRMLQRRTMGRYAQAVREVIGEQGSPRQRG